MIAPSSVLAGFVILEKEPDIIVVHLIVIDFERIESESREWTIGHVGAGKEVFRAEIQDAGFTLAEENNIDSF